MPSGNAGGEEQVPRDAGGQKARSGKGRGKRPRQAVVVVHGIGEQRPAATMRGYVNALLGESDAVIWAPDRISGEHDLRRAEIGWRPALTKDSGSGPIFTDVYEYYWADLVKATHRRHVTHWLVTLLRATSFWRRAIRYVPRFAVAALAVACVGGLVWLLYRLTPIQGFISRLPALATRTVGLAITGATGVWVVTKLGDAARYFDDVAANVSTRRDIRRRGVDILRRLHEEPREDGSQLPKYERIVVIGHSLGSVLAYDMVRHYWSQVNLAHNVDTSGAAHRAAQDVDEQGEAIASRKSRPHSARPDRFTDFQNCQRHLAEKLPDPAEGSGLTNRWAITDLLTIASPLTYADVLLAKSQRDLRIAQWQRELATCPPARMLSRPSYRMKRRLTEGGPIVETFHQAACFALTRWTNLYFGTDPVGGPVGPLFGAGVVDIRLKASRLLRVHSDYTRDPHAQEVLRWIVRDGASRRSEDAGRIRDIRRETLVRAIRDLSEKTTGASSPEAAIDAIPAFQNLDRRQRRHVGRCVELLHKGHEGESPGTAEDVADELLEDAHFRSRIPLADLGRS